MIAYRVEPIGRKCFDAPKIVSIEIESIVGDQVIINEVHRQSKTNYDPDAGYKWFLNETEADKFKQRLIQKRIKQLKGMITNLKGGA